MEDGHLEKRSGFRTAVINDAIDLRADIGRLDEAIEDARKLRSPTQRLEELSKLLARAGRCKELREVLSHGDKPTDGCVWTKGKFEQSFGYYVARVKFQKETGHWSAFWMNGDGIRKVGDGGRDGTEIEIMEKPWHDDRVQHRSLGWLRQGPQVRRQSRQSTRSNGGLAYLWRALAA